MPSHFDPSTDPTVVRDEALLADVQRRVDELRARLPHDPGFAFVHEDLVPAYLRDGHHQAHAPG